MQKQSKKGSKRFISLFFATIFVLSFSLMQFTDTQADRFDSQIAELKAQNSHSHDEVNALELRANNIQDAINKMQARINDLQAKIKANKAKNAKLKRDIKVAEKQLAQQQDVLGQNIRKMYVEDEISTFEMLATSNDLGDFMDKQQYRNVVGDKIRSQVEAIKALKQKLAKQRAQIEALIKEDEEMREEIDKQKAEQDRLLAMNKAEQASFNKKIIANNKKIDEFRREQARIAAALQSRSYSVAPVGYVSGGDVIGRVGNTGFSSGAHLHLEARNRGGITSPWKYMKHRPVNGAYISQDYGQYNTWYRNNRHPGIDFAGGDGYVRAIDSGNLYRGCSNNLLGTRNNDYGYVAIVEHSNGIRSIYAHMSGGPAACNYNTFR